MKTEIEAKVKVADLSYMVERLRTASATFERSEKHHDSYFIDKGDDLTKRDRGLRLRRLRIDDNESVFLTYKGPRQKTRFKSRHELEIAVSDFATTSAMLEALGFEKTLEFEKRRALWTLHDCEVCLDELPLLGTFVEVEGPDEEHISAVLDTLGLQSSEHISEGYSRLMKTELQKSRITSRTVVFDDHKQRGRK